MRNELWPRGAPSRLQGWTLLVNSTRVIRDFFQFEKNFSVYHFRVLFENALTTGFFLPVWCRRKLFEEFQDIGCKETLKRYQEVPKGLVIFGFQPSESFPSDLGKMCQCRVIPHPCLMQLSYDINVCYVRLMNANRVMP